jgi:serine/threonine-protein kinase
MQQTVLNGRYELEQKIGEGGMATVYRGYDIRLNRRVAIKVLHSQYANDPDFLSRFEHEAQAAANLNHPNVVNVYDTGQDGLYYYIVMEYVDGLNLKTLINREAPLMVANAIAIAEAIASGLDAAHRVGMVHRDIKPQNILVKPDGHVQITDFGIAKSHLSTAMTRTGITFGTADYISPEQAQGLDATPRSDIYSLGVTLYEMLTGRLPFTGDSAVSVAMQHVNTPVPPLRQFNPQVPPNLEAIVARALSKDPEQRPSSAQEFAHMLRNYRNIASQATVVAQAPSPSPAQRYPSSAQPRSHYPHAGSGGSSNTSTTGGRSTIPAPRSGVGRAPQQGIGCGIFIVGMAILAGVFGLVLLFTSGVFDSMLAGFDNPPTPMVQTTVTPTATPEISPTPTVTPSPVPLVQVPSIVGMSEAEARRQVQQAGLVPVNSGQSWYNDTIAQGSVVEQDVPAEIEIPEGQPVTYSLSLGPEFRYIDVPNLSGLRLEDARAEANRLGLNVQVEERPSTFSQGFVVEQEPAAGLRIREGETVNLVVSLGDVVWMPNLMGISEQEAKDWIATVDGIYYSWSDEQGPDKLGDQYYQLAPGTVVSTVPDKDQWVPRGTGVTLGVRAYD